MKRTVNVIHRLLRESLGSTQVQAHSKGSYVMIYATIIGPRSETVIIKVTNLNIILNSYYAGGSKKSSFINVQDISVANPKSLIELIKRLRKIVDFTPPNI